MDNTTVDAAGAADAAAKGSRDGHRDVLYELEMYRAQLAEARRRNAPQALIRGLETEIEYWATEVDRELPDHT